MFYGKLFYKTIRVNGTKGVIYIFDICLAFWIFVSACCLVFLMCSLYGTKCLEYFKQWCCSGICFTNTCWNWVLFTFTLKAIICWNAYLTCENSWRVELHWTLLLHKKKPYRKYWKQEILWLRYYKICHLKIWFWKTTQNKTWKFSDTFWL